MKNPKFFTKQMVIQMYKIVVIFTKNQIYFFSMNMVKWWKLPKI